MSVVTESEIKWSSDQMVEISLNEPDDFLKVRETLTRIGVASRKEKKIYQSCHILHKQGRYFLVHFKELFALDGKHANLTSNDVQRRNRIAQLLSDWGLVEVLNTDQIKDIAPLNQIKVLAYRDKGDWILETKYNIGSKKKKRGILTIILNNVRIVGSVFTKRILLLDSVLNTHIMKNFITCDIGKKTVTVFNPIDEHIELYLQIVLEILRSLR